MWVRSLSMEDPLEEEMATHFSILAQRIPRTEEPGGLQSMGSQSQTQPKRLSKHTHMNDYRIGQNIHLGFSVRCQKN